MAKHIYISSVFGTATGDQSFTTQQTGVTMASLGAAAVYANLQAAVGGVSITSGDVIYFADDHSTSYAFLDDVVLNGLFTGIGLAVVSVDTTSIGIYKPGAFDENTSINELILTGRGTSWGVDFKGADNALLFGTDSEWVFNDATLHASTGNGDTAITCTADGASATLNNIVATCGSAIAEFFNISGNGRIVMNGGELAGIMPGVLCVGFGASGGASLLMNGVDMSLLNKALHPNLVAGAADRTSMKFTNCKLHADIILPVAGTNLTQPMQRFEMYNCDDSTGLALHRFYIADGCGSARNNDSVYNSNNLAWYEGSAKSSVEVRTTAICSKQSPFIFILPVEYVDLGDTASDKITINLVTNIVLTDVDIAAFLVYPDGTQIVQPNWVSTPSYTNKGTGLAINPIETGNTLGTSALDAADWVGEPTSPNFYKLELDTVGDAGEAFIPEIRIEVYKTSIDGTTDKLFIDSELEIGT